MRDIQRSTIIKSVKENKKELFEKWIIDFVSIIFTTILFILCIKIINKFFNISATDKIYFFICTWITSTIIIGLVFYFKALLFINKRVKEITNETK